MAKKRKKMNRGLLISLILLATFALYILYVAIFANITLPVDGKLDWLLPAVDHALFVKVLVTDNLPFFGFMLAMLAVTGYFFYRAYKKYI